MSGTISISASANTCKLSQRASKQLLGVRKGTKYSVSLGTPEFYGREWKEKGTINYNVYSSKAMKIVGLFTCNLIKMKPNEKSSSSVILITRS